MSIDKLPQFVLFAGLLATSPLATGGELSWRASNDCVTITNGVITVAAPHGEGGVAFAEVDLGPYANEGVLVSVRGEAIGVSLPPQHWNGIKVMLSFKDERTGETTYTGPLNGSFGTIGPEVFRTYADLRGKRVRRGSLSLGLENVSGEIRFDLRTLEVSRVAPAAYTREVAARRQLKGVMLPHDRPLTEDDFATLATWGATLARFQMVRETKTEADMTDLAAFDRWLDTRLDWLEGALGLAAKHGIALIVDMHSTPGGGSGATGNHRIFEPGPWARSFLDSWRKIAMRFKGRKGIYAFDLVNEPHNPKPKTDDCWNLQCKAAQAIRAIDPTTPIAVESDWGDLPKPFEWLCPLPLTNIIYQVHIYEPFAFTHQRLRVGHAVPGVAYPGVINGTAWNRERLREALRPVLDFQRKYNARILVGEFSAAVWAKGAETWLGDATALFDEYGWDWTYHAYREAPCWSLEHEGTCWDDLKPSADNPRKRAVIEAMRRRGHDPVANSNNPLKTKR